MPRTHAFVNVALTGVSCLAAEPTLASSDGARQLAARAPQALDVPSASEDDHYQLYESFHAIRLATGDRDGGRRLAERYLAFVEHTPPPASADERMARDLAQLRAALKLGIPERVIPAFEASERARRRRGQGWGPRRRAPRSRGRARRRRADRRRQHPRAHARPGPPPARRAGRQRRRLALTPAQRPTHDRVDLTMSYLSPSISRQFEEQP